MPEAPINRMNRINRSFPGRVRHPGMIALWLALVGAYLVSSALGQHVVATAAVGMMTGALLAASGRVLAGAALGLLLAGLCIYFSGSMQFLIYAPPLTAFTFMALFFFRTLRSGSEALITQVARKEHPDLPTDMQQYTRVLTWIWSLTFLSMLVVALILLPLLPVDTWSLVVHGMGYVAPAALFLVEYLYRHARFPNRPHSSLPILIANIVKVIQENALSQEKSAAGQNGKGDAHAMNGADASGNVEAGR